MSKELDIRIGIDHTVPDIRISAGRESRDIRLELMGGGYMPNAAKIEVKTTAEWNQMTGYIPKKDVLIVYSDRTVIDGVQYPGFKIADGLAYVADLPFAGADVQQEILTELYGHINDTNVHITPEERASWNTNPQINGVELVGNKFLGDLFPDGILINCGDSTGYPAPVIPPGVPNAEGVGF